MLVLESGREKSLSAEWWRVAPPAELHPATMAVYRAVRERRTSYK
jgi:hypothetical protein